MLKDVNKPSQTTKGNPEIPNSTSDSKRLDMVSEGDFSNPLGSTSISEEKTNSTQISSDFFAPLDSSGLRQFPRLAARKQRIQQCY